MRSEKWSVSSEKWSVSSEKWSVSSNQWSILTNGRLPIKGQLLPSNAYCLLFTAYCLLLTVYFLLFTIYLLLTASPVTAAGPNQAGLVVRFDDGRTETSCVSFSEAQISGFELLQRSGLAITTEVQGIGALVCAIDGHGCPANDCLCQCRGGECVYWSYWWLHDQGWRYAVGGASVSVVKPGTVEGWSWGPSALNAALPPPAVTFSDICSAAAASPDRAPEAAGRASSWLSYVVFILIAGGLLLSLLWRRQTSSPD
jgi:hypothetical protein